MKYSVFEEVENEGQDTVGWVITRKEKAAGQKKNVKRKIGRKTRCSF